MYQNNSLNELHPKIYLIVPCDEEGMPDCFDLGLTHLDNKVKEELSHFDFYSLDVYEHGRFVYFFNFFYKYDTENIKTILSAHGYVEEL